MRVICLGLLFLSACSSSATAAKGAPSGPVLVELFTSQGCSSCPSAEALLSDPEIRSRAIPLAFHVTYWDDLGWKDPFSSEAWTDRQRDYSRRLGSSIYTPQAVVGGSAHTVGSNRGQLLALVGQTTTAEPPCLSAAAEPDALVVAPTCTPPGGADLWVAIVEDGLVTEVPRGENAGRTLRGDAVVRTLRRVDGKLRIPRDPAWGKVGLVGFAQEPVSMRIVSAARLLP